MLRHHFALIVLAALITPAPSSVQSQSNCGTQQRREFVLTVLDQNGSVIDSLRAGDLSLKVGNSSAKISDVVFQNNNQPLDLVVLIDASVSQEKVLPVAKAGAKSFITSVPTAGRDRVAIVPFSNKRNNDPVLTSDFVAATAAIDQIKIDVPPGYVGGGVLISTSRPPRTSALQGATSLWDVIRSTTETLFGVKAENRHRVMLLFSDGIDTSSDNKLKSAIDDAIKYDVAVFSIGLGDPDLGLDKEALKKLSERTGGVARFPGKKEPLEPVLTEIAKQLRANYVIGYCAESNNQGKLQVEVINPEIRKIKPVLVYKRY